MSTSETVSETPTQTRLRLLDAAELLFAEHGFRGASVRDITQQAGCNLAAVNYHFGGKVNLYREVVLRRLAALRAGRIESVKAAMNRSGHEATVEELIEAFSTAFLEPLVTSAAGRRWMNLMTREILDPQLPSDLFYNEMMVPVRRELVSALERVAPGLDEATADLCMHSLIGQLVHAEKIQRTAERDADSAYAAYSADRMLTHVVRFTSAAVRALAQEAGR
jgi:AcrR family transcriptional regulator